MIQRLSRLFLLITLLAALPACLHADTIILRTGASHTGTFSAPPSGMISLTGMHSKLYPSCMESVRDFAESAKGSSGAWQNDFCVDSGILR